MRYIKHLLEGIGGVEIYPIVSLLIFFLFFLGLTFYVVTMKRNHVEHMSQKPLEADPDHFPGAPEL